MAGHITDLPPWIGPVIILEQGSTVGEAARKIEVTEQTYYRWRREYDGMRIDEIKRLKDLEKENTRLKRIVGGSQVKM